MPFLSRDAHSHDVFIRNVGHSHIYANKEN